MLTAFFLAISLSVSSAVPAMADESGGEASLSERISSLESELAELEAQVGIQTGALDDSGNSTDSTGQSTSGSEQDGTEAGQDLSGSASGQGTSDSGQDQTASGQGGTADPQTGATESDPQQFLEAVVESFNKRRETAASKSADELASMSEAQRVSYCKNCVDSELNFYNRYQNALFSDKNLQYYCHVYRTAIEQQENACTQYENDGDGNAFNSAWYIGYYNRVVGIAGLYDVYGASFDADAVKEMREDIGLDDTLKEQVQKNAGVDTATVTSVQNMLNSLGYSCGQADGICGLSTVRAVRHFQAMNRMTITGVIDSTLVQKLSEGTS